jgi:geranylgeranyl diphosphate synthase, type I
VRYALGEGGKRVRPALLTLSCEAVGGDIDRAIVPAMVVEMIHGTSLILDDMIDGSVVRRGKKTVNARWGDDMALIACDAIVSLAIRELTDTEGGLTRIMLKSVADTMLRMAEGEALELEVPAHTVENYYRIAEKKTASLFSLSAECGGLAGGGDYGQVEALKQYGRHLGLGFQIRDDVLDFISRATSTGKPELTDLARDRPTLVMALAAAGGLTREKMLSMDRNMLLATLRPHIEAAGEIARREADEARRMLGPIPEGPAREILEAICGYAVTRLR